MTTEPNACSAPSLAKYSCVSFTITGLSSSSEIRFGIAINEASGGHGACMVLNPNYDFDDGKIAIGAAYWTKLTERFLTA